MFVYLLQMAEQQGICESLHEWFTSTFQQTAESDETLLSGAMKSAADMWQVVVW